MFVCTGVKEQGSLLACCLCAVWICCGGLLGCGVEDTYAQGCMLGAADSGCAAPLSCIGQVDGSGLCQREAGVPCDPRAEDVNCRQGTACQAVPAQDGGMEAAHLCLVVEAGPCDPSAPYCVEGLACEAVPELGYACHQPVFLYGTVTEAGSTTPLEGAQVIALDAESRAVSEVAIADGAGAFELRVPVPRDLDGQPLDEAYSLVAAAQGYQRFPGGVRGALPIHMLEALQGAAGWVLESTLTQVQLVPLPEAREMFQVSGALESLDAGAESAAGLAGVQVVAEGPVTVSAVADLSGNFTLFNVPGGAYQLQGFGAGLRVRPMALRVAEDKREVRVATEVAAPPTEAGGTALAALTKLGVGAVVVPGEAASDAVAPRREIDTGLADGFGGVEAVVLLRPGAEQPEPVGAAPELVWTDDGDGEWYEVRVYDAFGGEVWSSQEVPVAASGDDEVSVVYDGPLETGMYYQFQVTAYRQPTGKAPTPVSMSEAQRGVFFLEP